MFSLISLYQTRILLMFRYRLRVHFSIGNMCKWWRWYKKCWYKIKFTYILIPRNPVHYRCHETHKNELSSYVLMLSSLLLPSWSEPTYKLWDNKSHRSVKSWWYNICAYFMVYRVNGIYGLCSLCFPRICNLSSDDALANSCVDN